MWKECLRIANSWNLKHGLVSSSCGNNSIFKNKNKIFFLLPNEEKLREAWLGARIMFHIKDKLPKNTFIYSDHFEKKCFDASWKVWSELFYKNRQINRCQVKGSVPFIFCYREQLVVCESSKQMVDKREKKRGSGHFFTSYSFVLLFIFVEIISLT